MCYIDDLKKLTEELPPVPKLEDFKRIVDNGDCVEYDLLDGVATSCCLFERDKVSVARTKVKKDGEFPLHFHNEKEYIIVYSGSLLMTVDGEQKVYGEGDIVYVHDGFPHTGKAIEDTEFIAITIPKSEDFPNAR